MRESLVTDKRACISPDFGCLHMPEHSRIRLKAQRHAAGFPFEAISSRRLSKCSIAISWILFSDPSAKG